MDKKGGGSIDLESLRGFTPGPWHAPGLFEIHDSEHRVIADSSPARDEHMNPEWPVDEAEANARLIAAAPSMHAELTTRRARDAEVEALVAAASKYADLSDALRDALAPFAGDKT